MDNYLNKDNKAVSKLMKKLAVSKTVRERARIFEAIKAEMIAEAEMEDSLLQEELVGRPHPQYWRH